MFPRVEKRLVPLATVLAGALTAASASPATADTPYKTRFLLPDGTVLSNECQIQPKGLTLLVVHGFRSWAVEEEYLQQAKAICHRWPEANVFLVDWGPPGKPDAPKGVSQAGSSAKSAGTAAGGGLREKWETFCEYSRWADYAEEAARDIAQWMVEKGISPSDTVVVAHSLGAHVAAFASNEAASKKLLGEPFRAILVSDPAGLLFAGTPPEKRLDKSDAQDVIVVHATEIPGDMSRLGTLDIYIRWPKAVREERDLDWRHCRARDLVTLSFLQPGMSNTDGTPFGGNALGFNFGDGEPRTFEPNGQWHTDLASIERRRVPPSVLVHHHAEAPGEGPALRQRTFKRSTTSRGAAATHPGMSPQRRQVSMP
ncbi:MAG: alpha/beta hydrolase family protein [Planctomycetota bacterium]|jgi:pimeloyl-ACP methyl ester carboxylesterase